MLDEGEELIAVAGDADDPINNQENYKGITTIIGGQFKHSYCPNCDRRKGGVHCLAGRKDGEEGIVMVKDRCNRDFCECKCRRFYDYEGKLYRYGQEPDKIEVESEVRDSTDDFIDNLNAEFKKNNNVVNTVKPNAKNS